MMGLLDRAKESPKGSEKEIAALREAIAEMRQVAQELRDTQRRLATSIDRLE